MKKYLSLIAVLALLVSCMIIPASAAGTFEAIISKVLFVAFIIIRYGGLRFVDRIAV